MTSTVIILILGTLSSVTTVQKLCEYSTCEYIKAFVIRRGFKNRKIGYSNIYYEDLPYYSKKEGFISLGANVSTSLKWSVGELRRVDDNMLVLLTEETGFQDFYALVLESKNTHSDS